MKQIIHFVHPSHGFFPKYETSTKIQIDNSLDLGWRPEDIILATNFPWEYHGVRSLVVSDDCYCDFTFTVTLINVIVELFDRKFVKKDEIYWYHDSDVFQAYRITEPELDLGKADMGLCYKNLKPKYDLGSIFFKESAEDIFRRIQEVCYKYKVYEECALMATATNNLLWLTGPDWAALEKVVPLDPSGSENFGNRIKTLNVTYNFFEEILNGAFEVAIKPIKMPHIHFMFDQVIDSFMYGKNSRKTVLMPQRLIKIFKKHGIKGIINKQMKNLMIYLSPEEKFLDQTEHLAKAQVDNSLELGWKKADIILITNFPYEYQGIKATVINNQANKAHAILQLLKRGVIKERELWWYHDLSVWQQHPIKSADIDLEDTNVGFNYNGEFDTSSIFFRTQSEKVFEWIGNRAIRLKSDEATALATLAATNYRNINTMYKKIKPDKQIWFRN